jgi:hypothetical protein
MASQTIANTDSKTTGHGPYKPRQSSPPGRVGDSADQETVRINQKPVLFGSSGGKNGSKWLPHNPPPNDNHARQIPVPAEVDNQRTAPLPDATVFVYNKPIAVIGDPVESSQADTIAGGNEKKVFAGNNNSPEPATPSNTAMTEGDDHDADVPGSGRTYVATKEAAGVVSSSEVAKGSSAVAGATDTTPSRSPGPLSKDCADIASIDPFPTGNGIDAIVLTNNYTVGNLTRTPNVTYDNPLRSATAGLSVEEIVCNLKLLAVNCIEPIKAKYPNAFVTNTYRQPSGNPLSQHPKGMAADIQFRGVPKSGYYEIAQWIKDNVTYDQLLLEYKTTGTGLPWIHISFNKETARKQVLTLLNNSTYSQGLTQLA